MKTTITILLMLISTISFAAIDIDCSKKAGSIANTIIEMGLPEHEVGFQFVYPENKRMTRYSVEFTLLNAENSETEAIVELTFDKLCNLKKMRLQTK